jgi:glucose-6-phosphate dehydrogenase assembly protein OpcA
MTTTLWDTNGAEIVKALSAERRAAGALASGLALTLVVVVDEKRVHEAEVAATTAAAAHPCRVLIVVRRNIDADDRLDAEVQVGGRLGSIEAVVMRMYGRLTLHAESVVLPLLAPDAPVVTWWHGPPPDKIAYDALGVLADRRVTDSAADEHSLKALKQRAKDYAPGDTDLGWTRSTPWRSLLASAFDDVSAKALSAEVKAEEGNPSAALIAGWLTARLGVRPRVRKSDGPGVTAVEVRLEDDHYVRIDRPDGNLATLSKPDIEDLQLPLRRRDLGDLIAEELRRLDADEPYAEALSAVTGEEGLHERASDRKFVWRDPTGKRTAGKKTAAQKTATRKTAEQKTGGRPASKSSKTGKSAPRRSSS